MKPLFSHLFLTCGSLALALLCIPLTSSASDVIVYAVGKGHNFQQTNTTTVVENVTEPWEADAFVYVSATGSVSSAFVGPSANPIYPMVNETVKWEFSNVYPTKTLMDAGIPNGTYTVRIQTQHDGIINADVPITTDSYPSPAPRYSNYTAAQSVNPTLNFVVNWDAFTGGTTNDFIGFSVALEPSGNRTIVFSTPLPNQPNTLTGTNRQCTIPAGTLQADRTYYGILHFYKTVSKNTTAYPGIPGYGIFASVTQIPIRTVSPPPTITQAPVNQCLMAGSNLNLSVTASGTGLSYQWKKNGVAIPGATNSSLSITNMQHGQAGQYGIAVSNTGGTLSVSVQVSIITPPGAAGSLDPLFSPGAGIDNTVMAIVRQPTGHLLVGGGFSTFQNFSRNGIVRLNPDGTLDQSFNAGMAPFSYVEAMALQPDGKIIIVGRFQTIGGFSRNGIARLNANGTLDTAFDIGSGFGPVDANLNIYCVVVQPDGKVLAGGSFGTYNGTTRNNIVRLLSNGSLDNTFDPGTGTDSFVQSIAVQADGKAILGGFFSEFNGSARNGLVRLNANGSLDQSFSIGSGAVPVYALCVQPDGKILIGGDFTTYNDVPRNRIARINSNGTLDAAFNSGTGAEFGKVAAIALQGQNKIIIGGNFSSFDGTNIAFVARLNSSGSWDPNFRPSTDLNGPVAALIAPEDGTVTIGGSFSTYNCGPAVNVLRLVALPYAPYPLLNVSSGSGVLILSWPVIGPNWTLQFATNLSWPFIPLSGWSVTTNSGTVSVTLPLTGSGASYRLVHP
jgi:uncharacterized delta-60 repeat protein